VFFSVQPKALDTYADDCCEVVSDASKKAVAYTAHTTPDDSGGALMQRLVVAMNDVQPAAEEMFQHLKRITHRSAVELTGAAHYYRTTDRVVAEAQDALLAHLNGNQAATD
jgi:hypothetical protein